MTRQLTSSSSTEDCVDDGDGGVLSKSASEVLDIAEEDTDDTKG